MKSTALLLMSAALFLACLWFFAQCAELFVSEDYLAGLLHIFVGFSLVRAGVELARLSVISRHRGVP